MIENLKIKVCGMKYPENIQEVIALDIDFIGFIFHEPSARFIENYPSEIDFKNVNKVGVFVNSNEGYISSIAKEFKLDYLQLHGGESANFCEKMKSKGFKIIKVFSVDDNFDFDICKEFLDVSDIFLFDTKGKNPGGNGIVFNWNKMKEYRYDKPFLLSGGIGIESVESIKQFSHDYCIGIDVNSGFEISPGIKNVELLTKLVSKIKNNIKVIKF